MPDRSEARHPLSAEERTELREILEERKFRKWAWKRVRIWGGWMTGSAIATGTAVTWANEFIEAVVKLGKLLTGR